MQALFALFQTQPEAELQVSNVWEAQLDRPVTKNVQLVGDAVALFEAFPI
jgi:hypothetical protein